MPYVTSVERLARKEGIEIGLRKGVLEAILLHLEKFKGEGKKFARQLNSVKDVDVIRTILKGLQSGKTLDELRELIR